MRTKKMSVASRSARAAPASSPEMLGREIAEGMGFRAPDDPALGMMIGYARVSTEDQTMSLQIDALLRAGVARERIYEEQVSGIKTNRPQLDAALKALRKGDTLVVWRLDRLGRSVPELIKIVFGLQDRGIGFRSLCEYMDTTTAVGKLIFHIMACFAEFERNLISERTKAGMKAARLRGHRGGRKRKLDDKKLKGILAMLGDPTVTMGEAAAFAQVGRSTVQREIARARESQKFKELIAAIDKWRPEGQRKLLAQRAITQPQP